MLRNRDGRKWRPRFTSNAIPCIVFAWVLFFAGPGFSQSPPSSLDVILKRAEEAQLRSDFQQAAEEYRKASRLKPSADVYEKLGLACFLGNSYAEAIEAFSESLRLDPQRWASHLFLGINLYKTNRFREALPHIERTLQLNPQQTEARYWLGLTYDALGDYQQGIGHLRAALDRDLENIDYLYALTQAYLDFSVVLTRRLDIHAEDKQRREALEDRAGLKPLVAGRGVQPWDQLVRAWLEVESRYKGALNSPRSDEEGLYILSRVYSEMGQLMAQRVWQLKPDSYRAHQLLGAVYEGNEDYKRAVEEYREALRLNPKTPGLRYLIGHAYWQMKRFDEAIPELEKELALNPNHASAHYVLGHIYLYRRELQKADHHLKLAAEAKPDFSEARKHWGNALSLLEDYPGAIRELELAAAAAPEDESTHYLLAGVYKKMGLRDKAQKELEIFEQLRRQKHTHDKPPSEAGPPRVE